MGKIAADDLALYVLLAIHPDDPQVSTEIYLLASHDAGDTWSSVLVEPAPAKSDPKNTDRHPQAIALLTPARTAEPVLPEYQQQQ